MAFWLVILGMVVWAGGMVLAGLVLVLLLIGARSGLNGRRRVTPGAHEASTRVDSPRDRVPRH